MEIAKSWKECFSNWPKKVPRRGVLTTLFDEQIPFKDFFTSESLLMIERTTPDRFGTSKVLIPYETIAVLKIIDQVPAKHFQALGFEEKKTKS